MIVVLEQNDFVVEIWVLHLYRNLLVLDHDEKLKRFLRKCQPFVIKEGPIAQSNTWQWQWKVPSSSTLFGIEWVTANRCQTTSSFFNCRVGQMTNTYVPSNCHSNCRLPFGLGISPRIASSLMVIVKSFTPSRHPVSWKSVKSYPSHLKSKLERDMAVEFCISDTCVGCFCAVRLVYSVAYLCQKICKITTKRVAFCGLHAHPMPPSPSLNNKLGAWVGCARKRGNSWDWSARDGMRRKAKRALRKFERRMGENMRVLSRSGSGQSGSQSRFWVRPVANASQP